MTGSWSKTYIQKSLAQLGLYERVRASWVYDFYWTLANRKIVDDKQSEITFYRSILQGLRQGDLIFDVGANRGYKTQMFLALGAKVVAVEPDGICQDILRQKFLRHRMKKKPLVVVGKAVSDTNSMITMLVDTPGSTLNTLSRKWADTLRNDDRRFGHCLEFQNKSDVETISMEQLIVENGLPFYVKIDVEGHELSVLRGMKRSVPYLSFEVNLPEFRSEGTECVRILERLDQDGEFNYAADCRRGLGLGRWYCAEEFSGVLASCVDSSIEVFWRTPLRRR
jgi:FkbM family methyltransferase